MPVTQDDVRRIALALPGVVEEPDRFAFGIGIGPAAKRRAIVWAWLERIEPKRARVPSAEMVAVRVADLGAKQAILASDQRAFFTEAHYDGYPAVLVRLKEVGKRELSALIADAWRCQAPKRTTAVARRVVKPTAARRPKRRS